VLDTVDGLPAHPLLVHAVVVLVPVTAVLAVLVVCWPAARRRVGGASLFVAAGTLAATVLTAMAGSWLQRHATMMMQMNGAIIRRHGDLGGQLVFWVALLTISMVCWWALTTSLFADERATLAPLTRRIVAGFAGVSTLVFAVVSTGSVLLVGQLGSAAVWG
jgi:hypothetical protein